MLVPGRNADCLDRLDPRGCRSMFGRRKRRQRPTSAVLEVPVLEAAERPWRTAWQRPPPSESG